MKLFATLAVAAALFLAVAAAEEAVDTASLKNPLYAGLKFPAGEKPIRIEPVGKDTILEEGPEEEVSAKAVRKAEAMKEKPESRATDDVNLPDNELETSTKDVVEQAKSAKIAAILPGVAHQRFCNSRCRVGNGLCPRLCRKYRCAYRVRYRYRIRYRIRYRYRYAYRRRIRVRVRLCRRYRYFRIWRCRYYYVWRYRYVTSYAYRYRYKYAYRYGYRYKYLRGYRCR